MFFQKMEARTPLSLVSLHMEISLILILSIVTPLQVQELVQPLHLTQKDCLARKHFGMKKLSMRLNFCLKQWQMEQLYSEAGGRMTGMKESVSAELFMVLFISTMCKLPDLKSAGFLFLN